MEEGCDLYERLDFHLPCAVLEAVDSAARSLTIENECNRRLGIVGGRYWLAENRRGFADTGSHMGESSMARGAEGSE
jgi:hypothetical protein